MTRSGRAVGPSALLAGALLVAGLSLGVIALRGPAQASSLQERVRAIAGTLRCPVCRDLSVADSPSPLAQQMRSIIAADLARGESPEDIRAGFVSQYGQWILLSPPRSGVDLVVWVLPIALFCAGIAVVVMSLRRWQLQGSGAEEREPIGAASISRRDRDLLDRALAGSELGETGGEKPQ